jgi:hypothetical protein
MPHANDIQNVQFIMSPNTEALSHGKPALTERPVTAAVLLKAFRISPSLVNITDIRTEYVYKSYVSRLYNFFYYSKKDWKIEVKVGGSVKNEDSELGLSGYGERSMEERCRAGQNSQRVVTLRRE